MKRSITVVILVTLPLLVVVAGKGSFHALAQTTLLPQGDEFNETSFVAPFQARCGVLATGVCPDAQGANTWSLDAARNGFLRIETQYGTLAGTSTNNARNFVVQPVGSLAEYTVTTSLSFLGLGSVALGQTAGLIVYNDDDHFISVGRIYTGGGYQLEFRQEDGTTTLVNTVAEPASLPQPVYLRITKTGSLYQASYSYNNVNFQPITPGLAATSTPTSTATGTLTVTSTTTVVPTPTSTPTPTGYTAIYPSPRVGIFAWGGTNTAVINNLVNADFDWFRVGANSLTPAPTSTPGATSTPTVTNTAVATGTATTTSTVVPTVTATAVPTATATNLPTSTPTPIPTATSKPKSAKAKFSYVSVWYSNIHIGNKQHVQIQAKHHSKQGIWTIIQFATGKQIAYYKQTDAQGFWQADFQVPNSTISQYGPQAVVTFQLWKGDTTDMKFARFNVIK